MIGYATEYLGFQSVIYSSRLNLQTTYLMLNNSGTHLTMAQRIDLNSGKMISYKNEEDCRVENYTIHRNNSISDILDGLRYNSTYEGLQRVSWDGGRNLYHVVSFHNKTSIYYDMYKKDIKYIYNHQEKIYVYLDDGM
jgi:hypothetical protein